MGSTYVVETFPDYLKYFKLLFCLNYHEVFMPKPNFRQLLRLSAVRVWSGTFSKVAEIPLEVFSLV